MAEEFKTNPCSGNWWNSAATRSGFDGSVSCSAGSAGDVGRFGWTAEMMDQSKARSCDESVASVSGSPVTFQDTSTAQVSDPMVGTGFLMDSATLPMAGFGLSSPTMDWSQAFLSSGRGESSFHAMLQEDLSTRPYFRQEPTMESNRIHADVDDSSGSPFKDMNQAFVLDQSHLNSGGGGGGSGDYAGNNFPGVSGSFSCPSALLQGLFEHDAKPQQSYDSRSTNYPSPMTTNAYRSNSNESSQPSSWSRFPQFFRASPSKQPPDQLLFSNNTPFWNASAAGAAVSDVRSGFYAPPHTQFATQTFDQVKPNCSAITAKSNSEGVRDSNSITKRSRNDQPAGFKKPRIETPSSLPTFKVRKEKLGDRITALQQLVSPFGKTDTASVLYEAIEYIKFLHGQVGVLTTPYLKNGPPMQHQQNPDKSKDGEEPKQDLRSRGLCLVPISSTFPVANEHAADFWTPTFGGTYR